MLLSFAYVFDIIEQCRSLRDMVVCDFSEPNFKSQ